MNKNESTIKNILADIIDIEPSEIYSHTSLKNDLQIDSTEMVDIVVGLEKTFGIYINEGEQEYFNTLSDIVTYINNVA